MARGDVIVAGVAGPQVWMRMPSFSNRCDLPEFAGQIIRRGMLMSVGVEISGLARADHMVEQRFAPRACCRILEPAKLAH